MNIKNWGTFVNEGKMEKKVIMNMFICRHESPIGSSNTNPNWSKCVEVLHSIKFTTNKINDISICYNTLKLL